MSDTNDNEEITPIELDKPEFPESKNLIVHMPPRTGGVVGLGFAMLTAVGFLMLLTIAALGSQLRSPYAWFTGLVALLPYLSFLYLIWGFAIWTIFPDRKSIPILWVGGIVAMMVLWGPSWPRWFGQEEGTTIRVMEWNVQRFWGKTRGGEEPHTCVAQAIETVNPDIVSLLEVSKEDLDALTALVPLRCIHRDYLDTGDEGKGGLAICTHNDLWQIETGGPQRYLDDDAWMYLFAELHSADMRVNILSVHLQPYAFTTNFLRKTFLDFAQGNVDRLQEMNQRGLNISKKQGAHAAALLERVGRFQDPTVLAGDFNSTRDAALHYQLRQSLVDTFERAGAGLGATVSMAGWLPLRVDYVYVTPSLDVRHAAVIPADCSDHRPVFSELVLGD